MADQPRDISAALAAMERIEKLPPMKYVPPWLRIDRGEPWEPEGDTHVMMRIGNRYYDSEGVAWASTTSQK